MNTKKSLKYLVIILGFALLTTLSIANSATILFPSFGGTGTSTPPTYGQLLMGNAGGTFDLVATSTLGITANSSSAAILTYMFIDTASDIGGSYKTAISLNSYTAATMGDISTAGVSTSPTLMGTFATQSGFPNVTLIPAGTITFHYDTEKVAGANNYYTYATLSKRGAGGTETVIATSDNSPQTAANTQQSVTVTAVLASDATLVSTDRLVVKVYGVMVSSTATIHLYYDDSTSARVELPSSTVDATNFVPYTGATNILNLGTYNFLTSGRIGVGTSTPYAPLSVVGQIVSEYYTATSTTATSSLPNISGNSLVLTKNSLGVTQNLSYGLKLENTTAAANNAQQMSPGIIWSGRGWNSGGAGSSQPISFLADILPIQGASGAHGDWILKSSRNNAAYTNLFRVRTTGEILQSVLSGVSATTGYEISANFANSDTQTTQYMKFSNAGTNTWLTFYFAGTQKGAMGWDSSGVARFYASGNRYIFHSGVTGSTGIAEIYSGGFYNVGGNFNSGRVTAGNNTTSPPATFSNYGSTALKTVVIDTPTTLNDDYTQVIVDCSTYNICSGTPSQTDCGTYTGSGQSTCESHLPCAWNAGTSCSVYDNESGMGTCAGTSGCSVATSACSSANNTDQSTCEALDDAYGGACSWDTATCPALTSTASCNGTSGCTATVSGDCSALSDGGGDGTNCATQPECSYDSGTGACSGSYFTSCSGNLCGGTYYNGTCNGTFGTSCSGTATCSGYGDSGSCGGEGGCSWTSGVDITMPASPVEQTYWIAKDYTSGTLRILPNSGQTINNTTAITSSSSAGVGWMLTWIESKSNWYIMSKH